MEDGEEGLGRFFFSDPGHNPRLTEVGLEDRNDRRRENFHLDGHLNGIGCNVHSKEFSMEMEVSNEVFGQFGGAF